MREIAKRKKGYYVPGSPLLYLEKRKTEQNGKRVFVSKLLQFLFPNAVFTFFMEFQQNRCLKKKPLRHKIIKKENLLTLIYRLEADLVLIVYKS